MSGVFGTLKLSGFLTLCQQVILDSGDFPKENTTGKVVLNMVNTTKGFRHGFSPVDTR